MVRPLLACCLPLLWLAACAPAPCPPAIYGPINQQRWAAYYDDRVPAERFEGLDVVVFDREYHPKFSKLSGKTTVLAYISAGEISGDAPDYATFEKNGILLEKNDVWQSHAVDIASPLWHKRVLAQVDNAAERGFNGVMLDTLDGPLEWAKMHDEKCRNRMLAGAAELIGAIHKKHPDFKIMLNRGFDLIPLVGTQIDYILAESIMVKTNVSSGHFALFPPITYDQAAAQLHRMAALAPHLQVFTLDYWDGNDVEGLQKIYATQRAQGFTPYVTTPDLRHFTPEPCTKHP